MGLRDDGVLCMLSVFGGALNQSACNLTICDLAWR